MSNILPLMRLTDRELEALYAADALRRDALRQGAYSLLDQEIRARLKISKHRYYSVALDTGVVTVDMSRTRVLPVKKLSKSDL